MSGQVLYEFEGDSIIRVSSSPAGELRIPYNRAVCSGLLDRFQACVERGEVWAEKHVTQLKKAIEAFDMGDSQ